MTLLQTQMQPHKCTDVHSRVRKSLAAAPTESWMSCVTPSQYPRIPAGGLGTSSSSLLLALPGERQGVIV